MPNQPYIVIGGGIAGLSAAIQLARSGATVELHEQAGRPGGRAATQNESGFLLNLGAHALYRDGAAFAAFREWGVPFSGKPPVIGDNACVVAGGRKHLFPSTTSGLMRTSAFSVVGKLSAAKALKKLTTIDPEKVRGLTVGDWIRREVPGRPVQEYCAAIVRVGTYSADLDLLSAEAAFQQVQSAVRNGVLYLDGGWQTLVDGLRSAALAAGVRIVVGSAAEHVAAGVVRVNGEDRASAGTILAVPPAAVEKLTSRSLGPLLPARAACLDIGLRELPPDAATFALGLDQPLYFSVHSAAARLAPEGAAVVHVAKYLAQEQRANRGELEAFSDLAMPGWRDRVTFSRFLPEMTVSHAIVTAQGRPEIDALRMEGVMVAGDWVGAAGMLADAAVCSARRAARRLATGRAAAA